MQTIDAQSSFAIPRTSASTAATIGQSIATAYKAEKKQPENIVLSAQMLADATAVLRSAVMLQIDKPGAAVHVDESRAEGHNWSGLEGFLRGLKDSTIKKKSAIAATLHAALFAGGLDFLRKETSERWMLTETKLATIKEKKLEHDLNVVGAADYLVAIHETHAALGDAAGITSAIGVTAKSGVQMAFDKWKAAMRCYIAQVVANEALAVAMAKSDAEIKAANDLAARLLSPVTSVDSSIATKTEEKPPVTTPAAPEQTAAEAPAKSATPT
jgi:hypothetical protein